MTLPTCAVVVTLVEPDGTPIAGANVVATLSTPDVYDGVVVPTEVTARTDSAGVCTLNLFPNALGQVGSRYTVSFHRVGLPVEKVFAVIPDSGAAQLEDCLVTRNTPSVPIAGPVTSVNGRSGVVTITAASLPLGASPTPTIAQAIEELADATSVEEVTSEMEIRLVDRDRVEGQRNLRATIAHALLVARNGGLPAAEYDVTSILTPQEIADSRSGGTPTIDITAKVNAWRAALWAQFSKPSPGSTRAGMGYTIKWPAGAFLMAYLLAYPGCQDIGANRDETILVQNRVDPTNGGAPTTRNFLTKIARNGKAAHARAPHYYLDRLTLSGDKNNTVADLHGVFVEAEENDPDYNPSVSAYNGLITNFVKITGFSGSGIQQTGGTTRSWTFNTRTDGNLGYGVFFNSAADSYLYHHASGNNGKSSISIGASASPRIIDMEVWSPTDAVNYPGILFNNVREGFISGGDLNTDIRCNGVAGYWHKILISGVDIKWRESSFGEDPDNDGAPAAKLGYIFLDNCLGVTVANCTVQPAYTRANNSFTYRPRYFARLLGKSHITLRLSLPPVSHGLWPFGPAHVDGETSPPVNALEDLVDRWETQPCVDVAVGADPDVPGDVGFIFQNMVRYYAGGGVLARTDGANQTPGTVGSRVQANSSPTNATQLADATTAILRSVTLDAGNFDVYGSVVFVGDAATVSKLEASIGTGAAIARADSSGYWVSLLPYTGVTGEFASANFGPFEAKVAAGQPLTLNLNARGLISAGSVSAYCKLFARLRA